MAGTRNPHLLAQFSPHLLYFSTVAGKPVLSAKVCTIMIYLKLCIKDLKVSIKGMKMIVL